MIESTAYQEPTDGVLTNRMDVGSQEFDQFQAILLNQSKAQSQRQKMKIELMALKFRMEDYARSKDTEEVQLVGDFLRSFLKIIRIRQNKLANYIGLKPSNLSKLINGERTMSHEMALILGGIFNVEPIVWLDIQAKNELNKLSHTNKDKYTKYSLDDLMND